MRHTKAELHRCRKSLACDWCGEQILVGLAYFRWAVFDSESKIDNGPMRMHPECMTAMDMAAAENGGPIEWSIGSKERSEHE